MPVHNAEGTLKDSVNSVLSQKYKNFELIIIDDFSVDESLSIIKDFLIKDSRIKLIKNKKNLGVAESRNKGISASEGVYISFLDSDDKWEKNKLNNQLKFMIENKSRFSFMNYELIDSDNNVIGERFGRDKHVDLKKMIRGNQLGLLTVMVEGDLLKKYHMPDMGHEDYATWIALAKDDIIADYFETTYPLSQYRVHKSISSNKIKTILWTWRIYRNIAELSWISSIIAMLFFAKNIISRKNRI